MKESNWFLKLKLKIIIDLWPISIVNTDLNIGEPRQNKYKNKFGTNRNASYSALFKSEFRSQSGIYDGAFSLKNLTAKSR